MSFTAPSLQKEYALVSALDPALQLPEDAAEKENALRVARETGNWDSLIKPGSMPTLFWVRPLPGSCRNWLAGYRARNRLTDPEVAEVALRLALLRIDNFGAMGKLKTEALEDQRAATREAIDAIHGVDPHDPDTGAMIVLELGGIVVNRLYEGLSPK